MGFNKFLGFLIEVKGHIQERHPPGRRLRLYDQVGSVAFLQERGHVFDSDGEVYALIRVVRAFLSLKNVFWLSTLTLGGVHLFRFQPCS